MNYKQGQGGAGKLSSASATPRPTRLTPQGEYSIEETLTIWIAQRESPNTQRARASDLRQFIEWLGDVHHILTVTPAQAIHYSKYLKAQPGMAPRSDATVMERRLLRQPGKRGKLPHYRPSPATINRKLDNLRTLYNFLTAQGLYGALNPFSSGVVALEKVGRGKQKHPTEALTPQEVRALFATCDARGKVGMRDAAVLACLFYCGLRVSEVAALNIGSVFFDEEHPYLMLPHTKGGGVDEQVVSPDAVKIIGRWVALRKREGATMPEPLFIAGHARSVLDDARRYAVGSMRKMVKTRAKSAGINKAVTSHSGRATAITHLLRAGHSPQDVMRFSRHADIRMVMKYYKELFGREDNPGYKVSY